MNTEKQIMDRVAKKVDELEERVCNVMSLLQTLQNSLFFADESTDTRNVTASGARTAKVAAEMAAECLSDVYDLKYKLDKLTAEPKEA